MSLVVPGDVRPLVKTSLTDDQLQAVIDRVEWDITARIGSPQDDALTVEVVETLEGEGENLFVRAEIESVTSILQDGVTISADEYQIWGAGVIERLPLGARWTGRCVVTYKPTDDRPRRKQAIIDLVRLYLERTAMQSESIAGEYSYTAPPNWELEVRKVIRRLTFTAI